MVATHPLSSLHKPDGSLSIRRLLYKTDTPDHFYLSLYRPEASTTEQDDEDLEGTASNLAELIALRKLRQSTRKEGIDLEKLNSVNRDKKRKKKKAEDPLDSYGLQQKGGLAAKEER